MSGAASAGRRAPAGRWASVLPVAAVFGLLALLVLIPLIELGRAAGEGGLAGLGHALGTAATRTAIEHTVLVALAVTGLAVGAGAALALAIERRPAPARALPRLLVASPLVLPEFVLGFAWSQAYGPAGFTDQLTGITLPGLFGPVGIVLVLAVHGVPLAYLAVAAGLAARADPALERAARTAGATGWTALRTITLPLLRTPLLAAAALVFVSSVNSFAIPQVLGTPAGFATMSTLVYQDLALSAEPAAFAELSVVALAMVVLVLVALGPLDLWLGRTPAGVRRGAPGAAGGAATGGGAGVTALIWGFAVLGVGIPMLTVLLAALTRGAGLAPVPANWTLANFRLAFAGNAGPALARSIGLALAAAVLAPLLGGLVAVAARRGWRGPLSTGVTLAFAVPGSALAVGIMIGYGRWLAGSALIILVAYLAKFWALGHRPIQAALDRLPADLAPAARVSGAGPGTAARTVLLPPLRTALITAAGLVFLFAFHELTMSTILYGPGSETFAVVVLSDRELGGIGVTAALALVLTAPVLLVAGLLLALRRHRTAPR